ncbi:MAG: alanine racemase [Candidatus Cloacimonetes bacterium]|nr:alanine racemase [Candidatus Cloacimonadota bacterium]
MLATSYIELSKSALKNNIEFIRKHLGEEIKFSSVIKGNAYGHGIESFLPLAEELGIDHFSVFSAYEAYKAFKAKRNKNSKIMIMGMITNHQLEWAIENDIEFFVFELDRLLSAHEIAKKLNKPALVHIYVETGMNRIGFSKDEMEQVISLLKTEYLTFSGLCTHYAGAESIANYYRVKKQIKNFRDNLKFFRNNDLMPQYIHCASSAAAMNYSKTRFNMVRIGILQYGLWPSRETFIQYLSGKEAKVNPLERIISWKTTVMNTKSVKRGEFVGYSNTFFAQDDMKIAVIPVGYSDGYSRSLSNFGSVIIHGIKVKVIGLVNMNMLIVDITDIPETKKGDGVVLIGSQNGQEITISAFGDYNDQMNYESLARLPDNIQRRIID